MSHVRRLLAGSTATLLAAGLALAGSAAAAPVAEPTVQTLAPIVLNLTPDTVRDEHNLVSGTWRQVLKQPGGHTFKASLTPDHVGGMFETEDGFTVAKNNAGQWVYVSGRDPRTLDAQLTAVPVTASPAPVGLAKHAGRATIKTENTADAIRESMREQIFRASREAQLAAAAAGNPRIFKVPALMLATWYDESKGQSTPQFQDGHDAEFFQTILDGFGGNKRGSMTEFYFESSFGQFLVQVDVYGPYTSAHSIGDPCYYGQVQPFDESDPTTLKVNDPAGQQLGLGGLGVIGMATEAVPQAGADIGADWGNYDNDGDGKVDFTIIIHSGGDAASTGNPCFTWSHAAQVTLGLGETAEAAAGLPYGTIKAGIPTSTPGQVVDRAVTIPESSSYTSPLTIGVAAHEMAHAIGEPDYYDTSYNSTGTGDYDVMSGGSYYGNPSGSNPTIFNPGTRVFQGWVTPTIVRGDLRGKVLKPRNVTPFSGYRVGQADPNLLLVPTYEIALGATDKLGHVWDEQDVYGLVKDPKTNKYIVEGYYVELVDRTATAAKLHPDSPRGAMFDRQSQNSGLLVWHFDYWRQSTTYFGHGNSAQSDSGRYQMDVMEFQRNRSGQDLQLNYSRGNPEDYLTAAATGITSGTFKTFAPPKSGPVGPAQNPVDYSGFSTPLVPGSHEFTVDGAKNNQSMTVSVVGTGDCKLQLTDPAGKAGAEVDAGAVAAPESITVKKPAAGKWTITVGDFAGCANYEGRVIFDNGGPGGGYDTYGAAGTWSNWSKKPTGWAFTNVRGLTDGLNNSVEAGQTSQTMVLDILNLTGKKDVSPGFANGVLNVGRRSQVKVPIFSNGSKAPGNVTVQLREGKRVLGTKTVTLGSYGRKNVAFAVRPTGAEGPRFYTVVVDPAKKVAEATEANNSQRVRLWVGPAAPKVLIVDDDGALQQEQAYAGALAALGVPYSISDTAHPSAALLGRYRAVIWQSGLDRNEGQLDTADRAALTAYLNKGGKVLFSMNRLFDGVTNLATPQSKPEGVDWASHYLGARSGLVLSQNFLAKATLKPWLQAYSFSLKVPPGRPFSSIALPTGTGNNVNGKTVKAFGKVTAIAAVDNTTLANNGLAPNAGSYGFSVDGDAAHGSFKTVSLGFNLASAVSSTATVKVVQQVLKHFGIPMKKYSPRTSKPLIFLSPTRDTLVGQAVTISPIVFGSGTVKILYRTYGTTTWKTLTARSKGFHVFEATIPGSAFTDKGVEFIVKAGTTKAPYSGGGLLYYPIPVAPGPR